MVNKIDDIFKLWKEHPGAGGQVLVTYKGKTLFEKCYGCANIELNVPITPDSIFHVASVTKQFTAMCIMMLHEQGKVDVFADVREYIPDLIGCSEPITVKQMLNHVSGLREHLELFRLGGLSTEDCIHQQEARNAIARQKGLNFAPGTAFAYTNTNYILLAEIVERVSGMSFARYCKENIFDPLGMHNSFIREDSHQMVPGKVYGYHDDGYTYTYAPLSVAMYGGSGLQTNCRDLTVFLRQYMHPTLISRKTMDEIMLHIPEINGKKGNYAGGVRIDQMLGHRLIHHGGVNAAYRAVGQVYPEDDLIITACTNTYNIPIETAARDIARIVLGLPERKSKTLDEYKTEQVDLKDIDGIYYGIQNGPDYEIRVKEGIVYLDGARMEQVEGNLYRQGRRDIMLAIGDPMAVKVENQVTLLRKLTEQLTPEQAEEYVGMYYCDDIRMVEEIVREGNRLWMKHWKKAPEELVFLRSEEFFYGGFCIKFQRNAAGKVIGYQLSSGNLRNVPYKKLENVL